MIINGYDYIGYEFHEADKAFNIHPTRALKAAAIRELRAYRAKAISKFSESGIFDNAQARFCQQQHDECHRLWLQWAATVDMVED